MLVSGIAVAWYFSMLIFSGTTLPFELMPELLRKLVMVFPLTHEIQLMKATSLGLPIDNLWLLILVMITVSIICMGIAFKGFEWE